MHTKHRLNCFCGRQPLLAIYGIDSRGRLYVHIKVYKQRRVFAEFIARDGIVELSCRECFRWHRITFKKDNRAVLTETPVPVEVIREDSNDQHTGAA